MRGACVRVCSACVCVYIKIYTGERFGRLGAGENNVIHLKAETAVSIRYTLYTCTLKWCRLSENKNYEEEKEKKNQNIALTADSVRPDIQYSGFGKKASNRSEISGRKVSADETINK